MLVCNVLEGLGPKYISELPTQKLLTAYVLNISGEIYFSAVSYAVGALMSSRSTFYHLVVEMCCKETVLPC